ncbi:DUF3514 domain-containing protein [Ehrlichia muris subsp. eauclairensis]|uniref:DUF3514 domain-containing protein n=1 Tax=Ehrlichia muris TaxID=35795 RepID=UPI0012E07180
MEILPVKYLATPAPELFLAPQYSAKKCIMKFQSTVKCFLKMHTEYALSFMNMFNVCEDEQVVLKSDMEKALFTVTENLPLCVFIIKLGILEHLLTRFCMFNMCNSLRYCASHFDNQKFVDSVMGKFLAADHHKLTFPLVQLGATFWGNNQPFQRQAVYKLHSSKFYVNLLDICYKFACISNARERFANEVVDFVVLSCITCFGQMYKVKRLAAKEYAEKRLYAVAFNRFSSRLRNTFRHLYYPQENPVEEISGLKIPRNIIQMCDEKFYGTIKNHVEANSMDFGVIVSHLASFARELLLDEEVLSLIRQDIDMYYEVVEKRYLTMGCDSSYSCQNLR